VIVALLGATPPRLDAVRPEVPPALADAVAHALEKAPADRPPSAAALREALTAALRGVR
jgi:serine/threonine-protein kinase